MDLDTAEEKMLRAIVQTALADAASGHPFSGRFRGFTISASPLAKKSDQWVRVEVRIAHRFDVSAETRRFLHFSLAPVCREHRETREEALGENTA